MFGMKLGRPLLCSCVSGFTLIWFYFTFLFFLYFRNCAVSNYRVNQTGSESAANKRC